MTQENNLGHTIKFIKVEPGTRVNDSHKSSNAHFLGVVPAKGPRVAAYLVYAVHDGKKAPTRKRV